MLPTLIKKPIAGVEIEEDENNEEPDVPAVGAESRPNTGLKPLNPSSRPVSRAATAKSAIINTPVSVPTPEVDPPRSHIEEEEHGANMEDLLKGFDKTCALCVQTFPKKSLEMKVLWKHVIALRRSWNPSLVPKVIEALDQSITMYNLVNVCAFCSQFFDPDFPGGIAYPQQEHSNIHPTGVIGAIVEEKKPFLKYLDTRHMDNTDAAVLRATTSAAMMSQRDVSVIPQQEFHRLSVTSGDGDGDGSLCLSGISGPAESTGSGEKWWVGVIGDSGMNTEDGSMVEDTSISGHSYADESIPPYNDTGSVHSVVSRNYLRSASVLMSRARARRAIAIDKEIEQNGDL